MIQELNIDNDNKKIDVILMNPPYSKNKVGDEFYKHFIYKVREISKNSIIIHPSGIFDSVSNSTKEKKLYNNSNVEVEYINSKVFDANIRGNIIISSFLDKPQNMITVINDKIIKKYNSLDEIRFENSEYLEKFESKLKDFLQETQITLGEKINFGPRYSGFTRRDLIKTELNTDNLYVIIYKPNASFNGILYKSIHDKEPIKFDKQILNGSATCFVEFNKNESDLARNFIKYTKTDFIKLCCLVSKYIVGKKIKYLSVPWLDFSKSYTDEELFNMIGMEYDKEEINNILKDKI